MLIIYIILGFIGLILVIAAFTGKDYTIQREIVINKPDSTVYEYLRYLKNHKNFNAWFLKDPNMKESFKGTDGQIGFVYAYEGNKEVGAGEQELMSLAPNKSVGIELRFLKPFKTVSTTPFDLEALGLSQTKVKWTMNGQMNYPINISLLFVNMDSFLGKDVQKSLENLKQNLEK